MVEGTDRRTALTMQLQLLAATTPIAAKNLQATAVALRDFAERCEQVARLAATMSEMADEVIKLLGDERPPQRPQLQIVPVSDPPTN